MPKRSRVWLTAAVLLLVLSVPAILWMSLTYEPSFYRSRVLPAAGRRTVARQFVTQSLQLRNDIMNEPRWEAVFSDDEVNAWLAEDLTTHFADLIPPGVQEPRVVFEPNRAVLAFRLDQAPFHSVVWIVVRAEVREPNLLALTLEKVRAGALPVAPEKFLDQITAHAVAQGLQVRWIREGDEPVALIRYQPHFSRTDILLDRLQLLDGRIRLMGRSEKASATVLKLPNQRVLESTFPRRATQRPVVPGVTLRESSSSPRNLIPSSRTTTRSSLQLRVS
jgi:hypothetical protein